MTTSSYADQLSELFATLFERFEKIIISGQEPSNVTECISVSVGFRILFLESVIY